MREWSNKIEHLGSAVRFARDTLRVVIREGIPWRLTLDQLYDCGVQAFSTTVSTGFFVGAIMALQIELQLRSFGAEGTVGGIATSVTIRNVGPVLIGFILVGKVGALTTAVLGTMRVTDQIDSLVCLGVSPLRVIVAPRMIAVVFSSFILLMIGLVISVGGGATMASLGFGLNPIHYVSQIPRFVTPWSVGVGLIKSIIFGCALGLTSCYRGYFVTGGAGGVGRTVRDAAITSLIAIITLDFFISWAASAIRNGVSY